MEVIQDRFSLKNIHEAGNVSWNRPTKNRQRSKSTSEVSSLNVWQEEAMNLVMENVACKLVLTWLLTFERHTFLRITEVKTQNRRNFTVVAPSSSQTGDGRNSQMSTIVLVKEKRKIMIKFLFTLEYVTAIKQQNEEHSFVSLRGFFSIKFKSGPVIASTYQRARFQIFFMESRLEIAVFCPKAWSGFRYNSVYELSAFRKKYGINAELCVDESWTRLSPFS
jgi:hypothetical protein